MAHYISLVAYHDQGRRRAPAHWRIMITAVEGADVGKVYHAIGSPFHGYFLEILPRYDISKTNRRHTRTTLGKIEDAWVDRLDQVSKSIKCPNKSPNPLDPFAGSNCQDWAMDFFRELVSLGAMDASVLAAAESCPKE